MGVAVNSPLLYTMEIVHFEHENYCVIRRWTPEVYRDFTIALFVVSYVVPLSIMSVLYSFVVHKLWVRKVPGNQTADTQRRSEKYKKKVLKMLIAVVILFELCRLLIYINQFILFFDREYFPCDPPASFVFTACFLGHANSAINPAIYAIFNRNFRKGFIDVLLCGGYRNRSIAAQTNPHRNRQNTCDPNVDDARVRPRLVHSTSL